MSRNPHPNNEKKVFILHKKFFNVVFFVNALYSVVTIYQTEHHTLKISVENSSKTCQVHGNHRHE